MVLVESALANNFDKYMHIGPVIHSPIISNY